MNTLRIEDAEFAELYWRFDHGEKPANNTEQARLEAFLKMVIRHAALAWREYDAGLIARDDLISVLAGLRSYRDTELGQDVWATLSKNLGPDFVKFIEDAGYHCGKYTGTGSYC